MPANVTRQALRERIRFEADMVNSTVATDAEINTLINTHGSELFDRLVDACPAEYFATDYTVPVVAGTVAYAVPAGFRSLARVLVQDGADATHLREVFPKREGQRSLYRAPQGAYVVTLRYVQTPPVLTTDNPDATGQIDGVSGWDELVVQLCVRALLRKQRRDVTDNNVAIAELRDRVMMSAPKRDRGGPNYVADVEMVEASTPWLSGTINAYELRAGYLDLFEYAPRWWP